MAFFLGVCLPSWGAEPPVAARWRVLVVAQPDDLGLETTHPAYQRAQGAIFNELHGAGFDLWNVSADPGLPECLNHVCAGMEAREIIERVTASTLEIDLLVLYGLRYVEEQGPALLRRELSIPSRMIDLKTGRQVGVWDKDGERTRQIGPECTGSCLRDRLAKGARSIGAETGAVIALQLTHYERRYVYSLSFEKFARGELSSLERHLRQIDKGSQFRKIMEGWGDSQRVLLHHRTNKTEQYESARSPEQFRELLERALDDEGLQAQVVFDSFDVNVERSGFPYLGRYIGALLAFVLILYLIYWLLTVRKHDAALRRHQQFGQTQQAYDYAHNLQNLLIPKPGRWQVSEKVFQQNIADSEACCKLAKECAIKGDYEQAMVQLGKAEEHNAENPVLAELRVEIEQYREGGEIVQQAERLLVKDPAVAAQKLSEARQLNPHLGEQIKPLADKAYEAIRHSLLEQTHRTVNLASAAKPYAALMAVQRALNKLHGVDGMLAERNELLKMRDDFVAQIKPLSGPMLGKGEGEGVHILTNNRVEIGRTNNAKSAAISLGFKRLSRAGKQTYIERQAEGIVVQDQGSTNGTWLDEQTLSAGKATALVNDCHVLSLGGRLEPAERGLCQFNLFKLGHNAGSLVINLDNTALALVNKTELARSWADLSYDQCQTWVLLGQTLVLGVDEQGHCDVGCVRNSQPLAQLSYRNNDGGPAAYWIGPASEGSADTDLFVDDVRINAEVPLLSEAKIKLGKAVFWLEASTPIKEIT